MTPISKINPVWGDAERSGQMDSVPSALVSNGWNADEQPPIEYENHRRNLTENKINEVIREVNETGELDSSASVFSRCTGLPDETDRIHPQSDINSTTNIASGVRLTDICVGYDNLHLVDCVFGLHAEVDSISVFRNTTDGSYTVERTTVTLSDGPIDDGYTPINICCDGYYIYIAANTGSGCKIYKYALSDTTIISGTLVASRAFGSADLLKPVDCTYNGAKQICVANDERLAFIDDANDRIGIISTALDTDPTYGGGWLESIDDMPNYVSHTIRGREGIVSDGARVWVWSIVSFTGPVLYPMLIPVKISDPTDETAGLVRDPGSLYVPEYDTVSPLGLAFDGRAIHAFSGYYNAGAHATYDNIFDIDSEVWSVARYKISSGLFNTSAHIITAAATWTGRRVAFAGGICPVEDLTESGLYDHCNEYQHGLILLEPSRGGYDVPGAASFEQTITIGDDKVLALHDYDADSIQSHVRGVVCADGCAWVWCLRYNSPTYSDLLVRVTSLSRR